jgi:hypothetical protein
MLAQGGTGPTKVRQAGYIEERAHAKNVSDGLASEIKNKVNGYSKSGFAVEPGTRNQVLLLAELYPKPLRDAGNKSGVWSPGRVFYAYYSDEVLASRANTNFKPYKNSKKYHFRVGLNAIAERAAEGRLTVREGFCACSSCYAPKFDFKNCKFTTMLGRPFTTVCPPVRRVLGALPAVMEIAQFAGTLKAGEVRAVDVAADQLRVEGAPFWLCELLENAFQATAPVVFAGEHFDEGFYLVKIKWYQFVRLDSAGQRCYRLQDDEHMLSVHSIIRCAFGKLRPVQQERGSGRRDAPLFVLNAIQCGDIAQRADIQSRLRHQLMGKCIYTAQALRKCCKGAHNAEAHTPMLMLFLWLLSLNHGSTKCAGWLPFDSALNCMS